MHILTKVVQPPKPPLSRNGLLDDPSLLIHLYRTPDLVLFKGAIPSARFSLPTTLPRCLGKRSVSDSRCCLCLARLQGAATIPCSGQMSPRSMHWQQADKGTLGQVPQHRTLLYTTATVNQGQPSTPENPADISSKVGVPMCLPHLTCYIPPHGYPRLAGRAGHQGTELVMQCQPPPNS